MGNDLGLYRLSIGIFYGRAYTSLFKKFKVVFCFSTWSLFFTLRFMLGYIRIFMNYCHLSITSNIHFLFILLILLILDNDVHQNPGPQEHELSVFHLNARSVRNKLAYLEDIASEFSIVCITESHLDNTVTDSDIFIDGFSDSILRKDRNCFGGGVLVYSSQGIYINERKDLSFENGELIWFEVIIPNLKLLICVVYRPPSSDSSFWEKFEYTVEQALNYTGNIVITGDLNMNLLSNLNNRLKEMTQLFNLTNIINTPTRMGALLDPVLVSNIDLVVDSEVIDIDRSISDHDATLVHLKAKNVNKSSFVRKVWLYKHADYVGLNEEISQFQWEPFLMECNEVDLMADRFTNKYLEMVARHIPSKTIIIRPNDKPWFNSDIRKEIRIRDRLHKLARRKNSTIHVQRYKAQRNKVNNMLKYAREQFFLSADEIVDSYSKNDPKSYWSLIRKLIKGTGSNFTIPPLLDTETNMFAYTDNEKANVLNNYFCSISSLNDNDREAPDIQPRTDATLSNVSITEQDVRDILQTLKIGKASGDDSISHQMLKCTSETVSKPLTILFNYSLEHEKFPSSWKIARVMAAFKKEDKSKPSNYRPISLLSCVGKVMERAVYKYIFNYIIQHALLYAYQSGFLKGHSTVFQLLEIYHRICQKLDDRMINILIFCDISKAFDRVWHKGLKKKLKSYGISGPLLNWLEDYISDRKQAVFINNERSNLGSVKSGVPQGSVLGPLLFLLYINDITDNVTNLARLFADDTSLAYSGDNFQIMETDINRDLRILNEWAETWLVDFNPKKTKALVISNTEVPNIDIEFNNEKVEIVKDHKHLGVTLSFNGSWTSHIDNIAQSTLKQINVLRKLKFTLSKRTLSHIYLTFIRPVMEYACEVWDGCLEKDAEKLEKIQLEAARIVTGLPKFAPNEAL